VATGRKNHVKKPDLERETWDLERRMNIRPKIKICCISSLEEAAMAVEFGADAIGLVGKMPSGPGVIDDLLIAEIAASVPTGIDTFLLTSESNAEDVIRHQQRVNTTTVQIVDGLKEGSHADIRRELPHVKVVQVVHVVDEAAVYESRSVAESADFLLLDSGNPSLVVKELGGTGRTHNWDISKRIIDRSPKPVFLAGGLNPENVISAIQAAGPYGIDVCSGVRTDGRLDRSKLERFFAAVRRAAASVEH